jgi:ATP-dependent DNA ligase
VSKYKFRQIEPQPARGTLREEMWDSPEWIAEEKYDGDRRIAQFCGKVVRFTGRRKSVKDGLFVEKTDNVPHLSATMFTNSSGRFVPLDSLHQGAKGQINIVRPPAALEGTVLDGEMICVSPAEFPPGSMTAEGKSKYVTSIMGSLPEEAIRKQIERGWLRYVVFDILFHKGKDLRGLPLYERQEYVAEALEEWGNPFVSASVSVGGKGKREFYEKVVKAGGEGVILKRKDHIYSDKQGWVKVKAQATADVVIMGFVPAKEMSKKVNGEVSMTKYAKLGLIGAIQCGQYEVPLNEKGQVMRVILEPGRLARTGLVEVATVSGMDDLLREEMTKNPKRFIGKVAEITHNGQEPTGRFRHPRFSRARDDKQATDCIYRENES